MQAIKNGFTTLEQNASKVTWYLWLLIQFFTFFFLIVVLAAVHDSLSRSLSFAAVWTLFICLGAAFYGTLVLKKKNTEFNLGVLVALSFMISMLCFMVAVNFGGMDLEYPDGAPGSTKAVVAFSVFLFLTHLFFSLFIYKCNHLLIGEGNAGLTQSDGNAGTYSHSQAAV